MASTRDKNSKGNYKLEQTQLDNIRDNLGYYNSPNGHAVNSAFPEHYIESSLFGIGSTNLEESKAPTIPQLKEVPTISFFKTPDVVKTKNIKPLLDQRPFIV